VNEETLQPVSNVHETDRILTGVEIDGVRLIDNAAIAG
jgi:pantothenate synthetase